MDINKLKKYPDWEFDSYKLTMAVTEVKNEIKNKERGCDIAMGDDFKTLREPFK